MSDYADFADRLVASGLIPDPWYDGVPRFRQEPLVLDRERLAAVAACGEAVVEVHEAAFQLCAEHPELVDEFLVLTPVQRLMWQASLPWWHGFARADVFTLDDGSLVACELNSDTPTGQPEAVVMNQLCAEDHPTLFDPNAELGAATARLVDEYASAILGDDEPRVVGLVYPTEQTEDLHTIQLYYWWLEQAGFRVILGSPFNMARDDEGYVTLLGERITVMFRHYKTDWWGERLPVWSDGEPFQDALPMAQELDLILGAQDAGKLAIVNPFGSVLTQNKRLMALMWERMDLFSEDQAAKIRRYIPETVRLDALHPEQLSAEREQWVLKSDYGAEGEEVYVGPLTKQEEWDAVLEYALPERWVAQRYFAARQENGYTTNLGPYIVAGRFAGIYGRIQQRITDETAVSVAVLTPRPPEEEAATPETT